MITVKGILQTVGTTTGGTILCSLPAGYYPSQTVPIAVQKGNVSPYDAAFWLMCTTSGNITLNRNQTFPATGATGIITSFEVDFTVAT